MKGIFLWADDGWVNGNSTCFISIMGVVGGVYCFSGALNQKKNHNGGKRPAREGVVNERIIHKGEEERVKKNPFRL